MHHSFFLVLDYGRIESWLAMAHCTLADSNVSEKHYFTKVFVSAKDHSIEDMQGSSLVTQPMLQRQPNRTELRLMNSYIQIIEL